MYKNPYEKGRLVITFNVKFPEAGAIDKKTIMNLEKILPPKSLQTIPKNAEQLDLLDLDPAYERSKRQEAYNDDDDMQGGHKRVQCANQ